MSLERKRKVQSRIKFLVNSFSFLLFLNFFLRCIFVCKLQQSRFLLRNIFISKLQQSYFLMSNISSNLIRHISSNFNAQYFLYFLLYYSLKKLKLFITRQIQPSLFFIISFMNQNIKLILLILGSLSIITIFSIYTQKSNQSAQFQMWKNKFHMRYHSNFENYYRQRVFENNKKIVDLHNQNASRTYNRGINQFSAMTKQQFKQIYLTYKPENQIKVLPNSNINISENLQANIIDWRKQGAVGPVKGQGHCGSCWAFSTVAGLEAISKLFHGNLQSFSQQQLVDCDVSNNGCHGGAMRKALDFVTKNGILLESQYPYQGVQGSCIKQKGNFYVSGHSNASNCVQLANALTSRPIILGIDSSNWRDYESGIFDNCPKQRGEFNHGVLLVGMNSDSWIIKNSWTEEWGQKGYMRLKIGNTCNVCNDGIVAHK